MADQIPDIPEKEYFSTGDVATHCAVTPNAVFKWVQEGKILADRTPGGHYRISRESLLDFLKTYQTKAAATRQKKLFQYCWEFQSRFGRIQEYCRKCIVYHSRTSRCYELFRYARDVGDTKLYCHNSCDECDYYDMVHADRPRLLVITSRDDMRSEIMSHAKELDCSVRFTKSEYQCAKLLESYQPDYIIFDCDIQTDCNREFLRQLSSDTRIPTTRIVMVGDSEKCTRECGEMVFAYVDKPFTVKAMLEFIEEI